MEKTKFAALAALMVIITATGLYISLATVSAEDAEFPGTASQMRRLATQRRGEFARRIVKNGVPVTLTGEVSALDGFIVVLNVDDSTVNVMMPGKWAADGAILTTQDLFDGAPYALGQTVNLHTLKAELDKDTHTITCYFTYEIQVDDEIIKAVLPFNIEIK